MMSDQSLDGSSGETIRFLVGHLPIFGLFLVGADHSLNSSDGFAEDEDRSEEHTSELQSQ